VSRVAKRIGPFPIGVQPSYPAGFYVTVPLAPVYARRAIPSQQQQQQQQQVIIHNK